MQEEEEEEEDQSEDGGRRRMGGLLPLQNVLGALRCLGSTLVQTLLANASGRRGSGHSQPTSLPSLWSRNGRGLPASSVFPDVARICQPPFARYHLGLAVYRDLI